MAYYIATVNIETAYHGATGSYRPFDGMILVDTFQMAARPRREAPGLRLSVLPLGRADAVEALTEGRADLALGFIWDLPDTIQGEQLYEESFVVTGLPQALPDAPSVSLDAYCAADHVLISPAGDLRGVVDDRLAAMGRNRTITLGLPAFLPALAAVASSGALLTLPARLAERLAPGFGLVTATPPLEVRRFPVSVFWHRRNSADPRTLWLRKAIADSVLP